MGLNSQSIRCYSCRSHLILKSLKYKRFMVDFPAPIGGTSIPVDFGPSVLFAVLYALLLPLMAYRLVPKRSRCMILIGPAITSIEHIALFSLRAGQAHDETKKLDTGLFRYMQSSFALGFVGLINLLILLLQCVIVNATYGPETYAQSPAAASGDVRLAPPPPGTLDRPRLRFWTRRFCWTMVLGFVIALISGITGGSLYTGIFNDQSKADTIAALRFLSTALALGITVMLVQVALVGVKFIPRTSKAGISLICVVATLVTVIAAYRIAVMGKKATSLADPPLNTSGAKAAFYVLHVLPEWLAVLILFSVNIKTALGTGPFGDARIRDETEKQRRAREAKDAQRQNMIQMEASSAVELNLVDKNDVLVKVQESV